MDREMLERHLERGLSLAAIGRLVGKHPSTVSYWLAKHGLAPVGGARHAPRGGIPRRTLEDLIERGLSIRAIASSSW